MVEAAPAQVSVLVVTYNSAEHLLRCLESIAQQDYPALEAIIIENASTDRTGDMLKQFTPPARIPWSVTLNAENRGFAAAQNQAIRQAQGEWLLGLNPDVVLRPTETPVLAGGRRLSAGSVSTRRRQWGGMCAVLPLSGASDCPTSSTGTR